MNGEYTKNTYIIKIIYICKDTNKLNVGSSKMMDISSICIVKTHANLDHTLDWLIP
jgi:hypothetical protein